MAYEDLFCFKVSESIFAFHTKTAFLVQLDPPTARFLELRGSVRGFLKEYPKEVLNECLLALSELYEEDLLPKELELESRKDHTTPIRVLDLRLSEGLTPMLSLVLKAVTRIRPYPDNPLIVLVDLGQKEKLMPILGDLLGVRLGVEQEEGVFRFLGDTGLEEALVFKPTFDEATILGLFEDRVLRVWMDWGDFTHNPGQSLLESVASFMEKAWEHYPTAKLEPIFSWIRAMYEATPPLRLPWSFLMSPTQEGAFCVRTPLSCVPPLACLDIQEVMSILEGLVTGPTCSSCPIRTLCCGRHRMGGLGSCGFGAATALPNPNGCKVAFDLFYASVVLYDRLDQEGRLEAYVEGGVLEKKTVEIIENGGSVVFRPVSPESLGEFLPMISMAIDGGLFIFEKHPDPSLRELRALLQEVAPKRRLLALLDAKANPVGLLWLSIDESAKTAEAVLWLTDSAHAFVDPMGLEKLFRRLLSFFGLRKIRLYAQMDHDKLTTLYETAGLVLEGVLREHIFKKGGWQGLKVYAVRNKE